MAHHPARRQAFGQPGLGQFGIGQRLLGGEGLGHHHDQRRLGLQPGQGLGHVARIDVGDEAQVDGRIQRLQRVPQQAGTEVRSADADVDDGRERLFGAACLGARANVGGEFGDGVAGLIDLLRHGFAQGVEVRAFRRAQGRVQDRAALGVVDRLAAEQGVATALDVTGAGHVERGLECLGAPRLFRQVQIQARRVHAHPVHPARIGGEMVHDARTRVLARHGAEQVEGLIAGGHLSARHREG